MLAKAANALRLQVGSDSPSKNVAMSSEASGISVGEWAKIEDTAKTAFFRTYA